MKRALLSLALTIFIAWLILNITPQETLDRATLDIFDPLIYRDTCSMDYVDAKIIKNIKDKPEKWQNPQNDNKPFASIEEIPSSRRASYAYGYLAAKNCKLSDGIENMLLYQMSEKIETAPQKYDCPINFQEDKIIEQFHYIYRDEYYAAQLEEKIHASIASQTLEPVKSFLLKKFEDPRYRKKMTLAFLQIANRQKNQCKIQSVPIWPIIKEVTESFAAFAKNK